MYISVVKHNSGEKKRSKPKKPISPLAQATFDAFRPFINIFDPGVKAIEGQMAGEVIHTIPKRVWKVHARKKAGETLRCFDDLTEYHPFHNLIKHIYSPRHVQEHIEDGILSYYTSGKRGLGLLYLDIDAHYRFQNDGDRAKKLLQKFFPAFFRTSTRGMNGYLKVRYRSIDQFNRTADDLERTLKRLFDQESILCDIEVKGTITTDQKSGRLAKLPFLPKNPEEMKDETDTWDFEQLARFQRCPIVNAARISVIAQQMEARLNEARVDWFRTYREDKKREEKQKESLGEFDSWDETELEAERAPTTAVALDAQPVAERVEAVKDLGAVAPKNRTAGAVRLTPLASPISEDAFLRNHEELRPFARAFYKKHQTFPTVEDALDWLKTTGRYSGDWEENEARRAHRVAHVLASIEQTFDPAKLGGTATKPLTLKLGRLAWWVKSKFGGGMTAKRADLRRFDPETMTAPEEENFVPADFIETFLTVAEVCVKHDPLENQAVPTTRFKKLWAMVEGGAAWNQRYFQVVRDRLNRMGVITIKDRNHTKGKAWKWVAGSSFPEGTSWKEAQRIAARKLKNRNGLPSEECKVGSVEDAAAHPAIDCGSWGGSWAVLSYRDSHTHLHNTLYQDAYPGEGPEAILGQVRPPP